MMVNYFFTADQHFGHSNVIKYCQRPFSSVAEMNDEIIIRHNEIVRPNDVVYHLGDFAFKHHQLYVQCLNGRHFLVKGNHDSSKELKVANFIKVELATMFKLKDSGIFIWLSHYAHRVWPQCHYGAMHLYGHSHGKLPGFGKSMDVGVDTNDYRPYALDEILSTLDKIPNEHLNNEREN